MLHIHYTTNFFNCKVFLFMINCAVICEYNPFHSGHKYQLDCIRKQAVDNIICIMSGAFVQSASPAFCDKSIRAECAISSGADAVIELPTLFSTASAQYFAEGAIKLIGGLKDIRYLAMGATAKSDDIMRVAEIKHENSALFKDKLVKYMKNGKSYTAANNEISIRLYGDIYPDRPSIDYLFKDPNNILCIEYIGALRRIAPNIEPMIIARRGAAYNETTTTGEHISATALRTACDQGRSSEILRYLPYNAQKMLDWRDEHSPDISAYKKLALYTLKCADTEYLAQLRDCSEGLEYLFKSLSHLPDLDRYADGICGKRYSRKRVARFMLDAVLGIKKEYLHYEFITRLLAAKSGFGFDILPNNVKSNNSDIKSAADGNAQVKDVLDIDIKASALYNTLCSLDGGYYNYAVIKA